MLKVAQNAIAHALEEMETSKELVANANKHLIAQQEENRKLKRLVLELVETPSEQETEEVIELLEHPCGFVNCTRSERAIKCIHALERSNLHLKKEVERLTNGTDS